MRFLEAFGRERSGGLVVTFALVLPTLLLGIGAAIDYGMLYAKKTDLQAAADASALTAASELQLANRDKKDLEAVAKSTAMANLAGMVGNLDISVLVSDDPRGVTVELTQTPGLYFMDQFTGNRDSSVKASATARVAGELPICMLVLDRSRKGALVLRNAARITGNKCIIYSNSRSSAGIMTKSNTLLQSEINCSAGGFDGDASSFKPPPLTDCPEVPDPLALRQPPNVGPCIHDDLKLGDGTHTLSPGTYCRGLELEHTANVTLRPGIYVIKDGKLKVKDHARLQGEGVGFYLTGHDARLEFAPNTTVSLSAPNTGPMAGLIFFEDRNNDKGNEHLIKSNNARSFVGTLYFPQGELKVDASKPVFDQSAYTVIIARYMDMYSGPNLLLNSDYGGSDIPLPEELSGVSSVGDKVVLAK